MIKLILNPPPTEGRTDIWSEFDCVDCLLKETKKQILAYLQGF
jgi:hypothetical protein